MTKPLLLGSLLIVSSLGDSGSPRGLRAQPPPPLPQSQFAFAPGSTVNAETYIGSVTGVLVRRTSTNWIAGNAIKVMDATAIGPDNISFSVPIFSQRGQIVESTNLVLTLDGKVVDLYIGGKQVQVIRRLFRVEGTNLVFLTTSP